MQCGVLGGLLECDASNGDYTVQGEPRGGGFELRRRQCVVGWCRLQLLGLLLKC